MLRKAGNFLRYLFGILMMLAGAGYWKEEKAYALSLLLLGIFLLPVTWNTIKKRFHVAKALPVLLPVLLLVSACALTPVTYSSKETQKASAESVSVSVTAAPTKKATPTPTETSTPTPTATPTETPTREKGKWSRRGSVPSAALSDRKLCPSVLFRLPSEISF